MKRAIITPTFKPHFKFVEKYLDSAARYLKDPENVTLIFTVSESEVAEFSIILNKYKGILDFRILSMEELLRKFNVPYTNKELLLKYEKFSYQTLKKFYTMLHMEEYEQFLVIDSESMFIRDTNANELFIEYFDSPFITYSKKYYKEPVNFNNQVIENYSLILDSSDNPLKVKHLWFLENFVWFYDRKILTDMFNTLGDPLAIVDKVYHYKYAAVGCFEICLYHGWIYQNNHMYNYSVLNADDIIKETFKNRNDLFVNYIDQKNAMWDGMLGLLELTMNFLNKDNYKLLAESFKKYRFNIIRCESTEIKTYEFQKDFLEILRPNILSASQNHTWGENNNIKAKVWKLLFVNNTYARLVHYDLKEVMSPVKPLYIWAKRFYYITKHTFVWFKQVINNSDIFK